MKCKIQGAKMGLKQKITWKWSLVRKLKKKPMDLTFRMSVSLDEWVVG